MTKDLSKPDPLTIKQAALGADLTYLQVHTAITRGQLRTIQPRRSHGHKIDRAEFERWLDSRRQAGNS